MLGVVIDIFHWIAGAVLALVGISYDRMEDCSVPVRQQTVHEASFIAGEGMVHQAAGSFEWQYAILDDGRVRVTVLPAGIEEASGCNAPALRLPDAPRVPVLRL